MLIPQRKGEPVKVDTDEYPRPTTTVEKLAALKAAFTKAGTVTAGNASGEQVGGLHKVVVHTDQDHVVDPHRRSPLATALF